jgi:hypothetical protein
MKRVFFYMMIVAAIAVAAAWNVSQSKSEMALMDVALENVEALAGGENPLDAQIYSVYALSSTSWTCATGGSSACPAP